MPRTAPQTRSCSCEEKTAHCHWPSSAPVSGSCRPPVQQHDFRDGSKLLDAVVLSDHAGDGFQPLVEKVHVGAPEIERRLWVRGHSRTSRKWTTRKLSRFT